MSHKLGVGGTGPQLSGMQKPEMRISDLAMLWKLGRRRLRSEEDYRAFQSFQSALLSEYLDRFGIELAGQRVLDLGSGTEDVMLVGHLPFMSRLASKLLTGDEAAGLFKFGPSSLLCLERTAEDGWHVVCFLPGFLE